MKLRERRPRTPELSNWGVFGDDDEVGTLNYLTPDAVLRGTACVEEGVAYPLNLPCDLPTNRPIGRPELEKTAHLHNVEFNGLVVNDDHILLATQGSSQWDSFVHTGAIEDGVDGVFYNGVPVDAVDERGYAHRNGVDKIAERGIAGRGVLVDVARMVADGGTEMLPIDFVITEDVFRRCLEHQRVDIEPGDIVCFRTGWADAYLDADEAGRAAMMVPDHTGGPPGPGISSDLAGIAHEQRWAAVTADNLAIEVSPFAPDNAHSAHVTMQRNLGMPFGELLWYGNLAAVAAADRRWDFLFVAVPLWIPGGMGSPANAMAVR